MTKPNKKNIICYVKSPDQFLSSSCIQVNDLYNNNRYNIL